MLIITNNSLTIKLLLLIAETYLHNTLTYTCTYSYQVKQ